jgi:hypothetical protein
VPFWSPEDLLLAVWTKGIYCDIRLKDMMAMKTDRMHSKMIIYVEFGEDRFEGTRHFNGRREIADQ